LAQFDPRHQTLRYANAGHVPGYLFSSSGEVLEEMSFKDLPLGVLRGYKYSTSEPIPLEPGYVTAILTDGITEAMNFNNEVFGSQRAIDLISQHFQLDAIDIINRLYQSVQDFSENQAQEDDITMVICKTTEASIKDHMMR
jgi:sigma-B regulation protein RsbU (phosphoserine phosphatase)